MKILILFLSVILLSGCASESIEVFERPATPPIVAKDYPDCFKTADMNFYKKWDDFCVRENKSPGCLLTKPNYDSVNIYYNFAKQYCAEGKVYNMDLK